MGGAGEEMLASFRIETVPPLVKECRLGLVLGRTRLAEGRKNPRATPDVCVCMCVCV